MLGVKNPLPCFSFFCSYSSANLPFAASLPLLTFYSFGIRRQREKRCTVRFDSTRLAKVADQIFFSSSLFLLLLPLKKPYQTRWLGKERESESERA